MASFVATQTVAVRGEHGQLEQLTEGVTFVHGRHFLTSRYPDLFKPVVMGKHKRSRARPRSWAL
jgi:hypothetical protein